ncbi:MAG TPA: hypothetical protein VEL76_08035 [Gemmataceae bacterium]|nr:hypothetical protein [Gemmataceae bacterium]
MAEKTNGHDGAAAPQKAQAQPMNKMQAVRRALNEMGPDATPSQMQPYIKQKFGIDMSTDHISTYKGDIRRKAKEAKKAAPKAAAAAKPAAAKPAAKGKAKAKAAPAAAAKAPPKAAGGSVSLHDIQTLKGLVGRVGAQQLRTLIDLFSR